MPKKVLIQVGYFRIPVDELYERICDRMDSKKFNKEFKSLGLDYDKPTPSLDELYVLIVGKMNSKRFNREVTAVGQDLEREYQKLKSCRSSRRSINLHSRSGRD
jgi:hypothetical protein